MVSVEGPPDVTEVGLNEAVAPLGSPAAVRLTVCAVPAVVCVFTVAVADCPGWTVPAAGLNASEKSRVGGVMVPTATFHSAQATASELRSSAVVLTLLG